LLKDGIQNTYGEGRNYGRERTLREDQAKRYKVIFLGPAQNDTDHVNKLTESLKDRFKLSTDAITKLMKSAPVSVKKELSLSEAERYKEFNTNRIKSKYNWDNILGKYQDLFEELNIKK